MTYFQLFYELNKDRFDRHLLQKIAAIKSPASYLVAADRYLQEVYTDILCECKADLAKVDIAITEWDNLMLSYLDKAVPMMIDDVRNGQVKIEDLRQAMQDFPEVLAEIETKLNTEI